MDSMPSSVTSHAALPAKLAPRLPTRHFFPSSQPAEKRIVVSMTYAQLAYCLFAVLGLVVCTLLGTVGLLLAALLAIGLLIARVPAKVLFALALLALAGLVGLMLFGQNVLVLNMANIMYLCLGAAALALGLQARQRGKLRFNGQ